jgi:hypothetical protein
MDGIPFTLNNSATWCIITNERSSFIGNLVPVHVLVNTIKATQVRHCYEGTIRLELIDDSNVKHTYDLPGAICDSSLKFNLLGIPKIVNFFNDKNSIPGEDVNSDGVTIKSSGCGSCLTWDHGQHMRNFTHGDSMLPEIMLYQGNGYFKAFCTRLQQSYNNGVAFAFSSAFSISPFQVNAAAIVFDGNDFDEEDTVQSIVGAQNTGSNTVLEDEVDWYTSPSPPSRPPLLLPPSLPVISPLPNTFE